MRFTPVTLALAVVLSVTASTGISKQNGERSTPVPAQLSRLSIEWLGKGDAARKAGDLRSANDAYESALAADPRNVAAYMALAEVARTQGLQGKAIRFYGEVLQIASNNVNALSGQGQALAEKGAIAQAQDILTRIKPLCRSDCTATSSLSAAIKTQSEMRAAAAALAAKEAASPKPDSAAATPKP